MIKTRVVWTHSTSRVSLRVLAQLTSFLALAGCVSDFAPGPSKPDPNQLASTETDASLRSDGGTSVVEDARTDSPMQMEPRTDGGDAGPVMPTQPKSPCDLSGRWIITERSRTVAYGAEQLVLAWFYLEMAQDGSNVTMTKGLYCGGVAKGAPGSLDVLQDDSAAWSAISKRTSYDGRKGTSTEAGGMCNVSFERGVTIKGMTVSAYEGEGVALPTFADQATATKPGWEDWDEDGHPGTTQVVSGVATGKIFTAVRMASTYQGTVPANASTFKTSYTWTGDRVVLATEPNDPITRAVLASDVQPSPDPEEAYVEWARLADDQATDADPDAKCKALRDLAPMLNPAANPK